MADTADGVSLEVEIDDGETLIRVVGTRDAALVVTSESGESVYLPPEEFDDPPDLNRSDRSPYESGSAARNPYDGIESGDSPYAAADEGEPAVTGDAAGTDAARRPVGVETTGEGFRVRHPEPITDLRFVR